MSLKDESGDEEEEPSTPKRKRGTKSKKLTSGLFKKVFHAGIKLSVKYPHLYLSSFHCYATDNDKKF